MDIACTKCGEPWDMDSLHDIAEDDGITWEQAHHKFQSEGCEAFVGCHHNPHADKARASVASMLHDIMGDDVDGIASGMEDAEFFGLFD